MEQPPLLALGPVRVHRHSLQSYGTLIAVFQTALLAMLVTSTNGVAAIVTVSPRADFDLAAVTPRAASECLHVSNVRPSSAA